jgi:hypothetical protein
VGLSWQQGPLSPGAIGRFLAPEPPPKRLLYAESLRRRQDMVSVQLDGAQLRIERVQTVIPHSPDRELTIAEVLPARKRL